MITTLITVKFLTPCLHGKNKPVQFKSNSAFINDNDYMPVVATPVMSPSVSLSPHISYTPSNNNAR